MGIKRREKICKTCQQPRYIFGHGDCERCYRENYVKRTQSNDKRKALFNEKKSISEGKKALLKDISKGRISSVSKTNISYDSDGKPYTAQQVKSNIDKAKAEKIRQMKDEHGYVFCEECQRNDCKPIDCSHDKSVDWCKNNGCVELAWDVENITMRGRGCHQAYDGLGIMSGKASNG